MSLFYSRASALWVKLRTVTGTKAMHVVEVRRLYISQPPLVAHELYQVFAETSVGRECIAVVFVTAGNPDGLLTWQTSVILAPVFSIPELLEITCALRTLLGKRPVDHVL